VIKLGLNPKNIVFKSFSSTVRNPLGEKVIFTTSIPYFSREIKISDNTFLNFLFQPKTRTVKSVNFVLSAFCFLIKTPSLSM